MHAQITFTRKGGFGKIGPKTLALLSRVVRKTASDIEADAKLSIQTGPKTGRVYELYGPRRTHQASAPGEAPATDIGNLVNGIHTKPISKLESHVISSADYSADLEYGTTKMAARPFMTPATENNREPFLRACKAAIRQGAQ